MVPKIGDKTAILLREFLPGFNPTIEAANPLRRSKENITKLNLPTAPGAEYFFTLWFDETGEREISANLIQHQNDYLYFWQRPYELAEFRDSVEKLEAKFCDELEILLTHETRVIQRKGWLFWDFRCEYREGEKWKRIYGHLALRWFKPPQIAGKIRVYSSAPVCSAVKQSTT